MEILLLQRVPHCSRGCRVLFPRSAQILLSGYFWVESQAILIFGSTTV